MNNPLSVPDAAQMLGLSPDRVRAMAVHGQLGATKIGDRWLVERSAVEVRRLKGGHSGRPFAAHNAWALLLLASGKTVEGIDPSVRSRLRRALRVDGLEKLAPRLGRRGESQCFDGHPGELRYLLEDPAFLRTGISAAGEHGFDLVAGQEADGYVAAGGLQKLVADHALSTVDFGAGNVRIRVVTDKAWDHLAGLELAPIAAVAIDLAEDNDPRSVDVGSRALRGLGSR
jgi:excisionase family DNA binding protein